eukprot:11528868-Alexandrium_andersonii.AAC.1
MSRQLPRQAAAASWRVRSAACPTPTASHSSRAASLTPQGHSAGSTGGYGTGGRCASNINPKDGISPRDNALRWPREGGMYDCWRVRYAAGTLGLGTGLLARHLAPTALARRQLSPSAERAKRHWAG